MNETTTLLGLRVELVKELGELWPTYHLHGPKGAHYKLVRNRVKPELMYAVNVRAGRSGLIGRCVGIAGNIWFSDKGGKLRPVVA